MSTRLNDKLVKCYRESERLATLGSSQKAGVELVVICKISPHQAKPKRRPNRSTIMAPI